MRLVITAEGESAVHGRSGREVEVLKFGHALPGGRGRGMPEPEASQIEGTEPRVDGAPYAKKGRNGKRKKRPAQRGEKGGEEG